MWNIHYQIPFVSLHDSTSYVINIYEENYSGEIEILTGGPDPIVTQEDDGEDIFSPIRGQSGYIRIVEQEGAEESLLEKLMPNNNLEKFVRLMQGDTVCWQGFIVAQAYSQDWDRHAKLIELPIKSMLSCLENVTLQLGLYNLLNRFSYYLYQGFTALLGSDSNITPFSQIILINDLKSGPMEWMLYQINASIFFDEDLVLNEGTTTIEYLGATYYESIGNILSFLGMTMRENGDTISICQYDNPLSPLSKAVITYDYFKGVALSGGSTSQGTDSPSTAAFLTDTSFRDNSNSVQYNQGARDVKIVFDFDTDNFSENIPDCDEDDSTPLEYKGLKVNASTVDEDFVVLGSSGSATYIVYMQPHTPRGNVIEAFQYIAYYRSSSTDEFSQTGAASYSKCLSQCAFNNPSFDARNTFDRDSQSQSGNFYTGSFPVRYVAIERGESLNESLESALLLQIQYAGTGDDISSWPIKLAYSLSTPYQMSFSLEKYVRINFKDHMCLTHAGFSKTSGSGTSFDGSGDADNYREDYYYELPHTFYMYCYLRIGEKEWNGSEWVDATGSTSFRIEMDTTDVVTNIEGSMELDTEEGFVVPIDTTLSGKITFGFFNLMYDPYTAYRNNSGDRRAFFEYARGIAHTHIISDFELELMTTDSMVLSRRTTNTYYRRLSTGFPDTKEIDLTIGTFNNNINSPSFVYGAGNTQLQEVRYTNEDQRPELHLLDRLAQYYYKSRKNMTTVIKPGKDVLSTIYTYLGRSFVAITSERNWKNDTHKVKLLEVTTSDYAYVPTEDEVAVKFPFTDALMEENTSVNGADYIDGTLIAYVDDRDTDLTGESLIASASHIVIKVNSNTVATSFGTGTGAGDYAIGNSYIYEVYAKNIPTLYLNSTLRFVVVCNNNASGAMEFLKQ